PREALARLDDAALEPLLVHGQRAEPHVDLGRLARRALEGLMRGGRLTEQALALGRRIGQRLSNSGDGLLRARPELRGLALGAIALALRALQRRVDRVEPVTSRFAQGRSAFGGGSWRRRGLDGGLDQRDLALGALKAVALGQAFADGRFDGARLGACVVEARSLRVSGALSFFAFGHCALRLGLELRALAEELVRGVARARLGALALLGRARDGRLDQR